MDARKSTPWGEDTQIQEQTVLYITLEYRIYRTLGWKSVFQTFPSFKTCKTRKQGHLRRQILKES